MAAFLKTGLLEAFHNEKGDGFIVFNEWIFHSFIIADSCMTGNSDKKINSNSNSRRYHRWLRHQILDVLLSYAYACPRLTGVSSSLPP
jgi:hypothetical protein